MERVDPAGAKKTRLVRQALYQLSPTSKLVAVPLGCKNSSLDGIRSPYDS